MTPGTRRLAILGAGTVGGALLRRLTAGSVSNHLGLQVEGVLVRNPAKAREVGGVAYTDDGAGLVDESDIVVELLGGVEPSATLMLRALQAGRHVVTANKAVLAERWDDFLPHLREGRLHFEAAVMAGAPVIGPLSGALRGGDPLEAHAILNGTTTFILSRLEQGEEFRPALAEAQRLGYAEADPTLDIEGIDAAHKLAVIARLAFDPDIDWSMVRSATRGIGQLTPLLVHEAMEDGGSVRLVGSIVPGRNGWQPFVRPVYLPATHPLADGSESEAILVYRSRQHGQVVIRGPGAGGPATAAAVLADLVEAAAGRPGPAPLPHAAPLPGGHLAEELGELAAG